MISGAILADTCWRSDNTAVRSAIQKSMLIGRREEVKSRRPCAAPKQRREMARVKMPMSLALIDKYSRECVLGII